MRLFTIKCSVEGQITIINNNFPSNSVSIKYDEKQYPQGYHFQANEYLKSENFDVIGQGWDELNSCYYVVTKSKFPMLRTNKKSK